MLDYASGEIAALTIDDVATSDGRVRREIKLGAVAPSFFPPAFAERSARI